MNTTDLRTIIIPDEPRYFPGQRWLNILLRSLHLVGIAGIGAGFLFAQEPSQWQTFWQLTLLSGTALVLIYLWSTALWLIQLKGLAILLKLLLLWLAMANPELRGFLFVAIVMISGVIAHAPSRVRGYSPLKIAQRQAGC